MFKTALIFLVLFLAGCATQPLPNKSHCDVIVNGKCQTMSPSEHAGAGSRGHGEEPKNDKLMYYIPPEQLWPEDFPTKPQVCASPFTGRLLTQ